MGSAGTNALKSTRIAFISTGRYKGSYLEGQIDVIVQCLTMSFVSRDSFLHDTFNAGYTLRFWCRFWSQFRYGTIAFCPVRSGSETSGGCHALGARTTGRRQISLNNLTRGRYLLTPS